jgi:hypothetical protein
MGGRATIGLRRAVTAMLGYVLPDEHIRTEHATLLTIRLTIVTRS